MCGNKTSYQHLSVADENKPLCVCVYIVYIYTHTHTQTHRIIVASMLLLCAVSHFEAAAVVAIVFNGPQTIYMFKRVEQVWTNTSGPIKCCLLRLIHNAASHSYCLSPLGTPM